MFRISSANAALLASLAALATLSGCSPAATNGAAGASASGATLQPATSTPSGMSTFTDPTENAFTIAVPQGWTVKGGIQRTSTSAQPWVVATSPDGATSIMVGDPSIPTFTLPSAMNGGGGSVQTAAGPSPVMAYQNAAQFAETYAQHTYGSACAGLTPAGSQAEPGLTQIAVTQMQTTAAAVGGPSPAANNFDGGSATFTCQANGVADVVGVLDVTYDYPTQAGGLWFVPLIASYRTPAASQAQTDQFVRAMRQSYQPNAQWQAQQVAAGRQVMAQQQQQGQQAQAALTQQEASEGAALNAQEQGANAQLDAAHAATMAQLNAQGQQINQNFASQQYNRGTNQQAEMRYIQNQTCVQWYDAAHTRCAAAAPN